MPSPQYGPSAAVYDLLYVGAGIKDYVAEVAALHHIIRERTPSARTLLDVACGTGQHLALLLERYEVSGVDLSDEMLAVARQRLPDVPLQRADMRSLELGRTFDVVLCLFSSIGYLTAADDLQEAFRRFARHVNPGGLVIVDGWVRPDAWRDGYRPEMERASGGHVEVYRLVDPRRQGRITTLVEHHLVRDPSGISHFVEDHVLALTPTEEYVGAAEAAGLRVEVLPDYMPDRDRIVGVKE